LKKGKGMAMDEGDTRRPCRVPWVKLSILSVCSWLFTAGRSIDCPQDAVEESAHVELFIAPHGDDAATGAQEKPFATLGRALEAVGELGRGKVRRITLRNGRYYEVAAVLGPEHSGVTLTGLSRTRIWRRPR
jgi:hypothetical protein